MSTILFACTQAASDSARALPGFPRISNLTNVEEFNRTTEFEGYPKEINRYFIKYGIDYNSSWADIKQQYLNLEKMIRKKQHLDLDYIITLCSSDWDSGNVTRYSLNRCINTTFDDDKEAF